MRVLLGFEHGMYDLVLQHADMDWVFNEDVVSTVAL